MSWFNGWFQFEPQRRRVTEFHRDFLCVTWCLCASVVQKRKATKRALMQDYIIDVGQIEELQMTNNLQALESIFDKARSAIVNGASVLLVRKQFSGKREKFDELSTLADFESYKKQVLKYM
jgi:hypothetical protein